ncbi:MAG: GntR family transcriptional regulator [Thermodesulfobacteriota bacterium]
MLKPPERKSLSDQVFDQLRDNILSLKFMPGEHLPSERELADILRINRSSVREALKRLEQARLIEIRHGEGSVVLDFTATAGFDLLRHLVTGSGRLDFIAVRSITEVRLVIISEIARLSALRIQEPELAGLRALTDKIAALKNGDDAGLQKLDFEFFYALARTSENLALVLLLNSIRDVYGQLAGHFSAMFRNADRRVYAKLCDALAAHDESRAAELAREHMEQTNRAILALYAEDQPNEEQVS